MKEYIVEGNEDKRIDKYICKVDESLTRVAVQRMINNGDITVNGCKTKPSYILTNGDNIKVEEERKIESSMKPEDIPLDVIYEDEDILIINKEKGMVVHPRKWKP